MRFVELDIFGVYVAPISILILLALVLTGVLRRVADQFGLLRYVWRPPLFVGAVYVVILSTIVLFFAR